MGYETRIYSSSSMCYAFCLFLLLKVLNLCNFFCLVQVIEILYHCINIFFVLSFAWPWRKILSPTQVSNYAQTTRHQELFCNPFLVESKTVATLSHVQVITKEKVKKINRFLRASDFVLSVIFLPSSKIGYLKLVLRKTKMNTVSVL